jgi:hypothetical protein
MSGCIYTWFHLWRFYTIKPRMLRAHSMHCVGALKHCGNARHEWWHVHTRTHVHAVWCSTWRISTRKMKMTSSRNTWQHIQSRWGDLLAFSHALVHVLMIAQAHNSHDATPKYFLRKRRHSGNIGFICAYAIDVCVLTPFRRVVAFVLLCVHDSMRKVILRRKVETQTWNAHAAESSDILAIRRVGADMLVYSEPTGFC